MELCLNYIRDWSVRSAFVLEGRSGAGKSQFLIQLMRQLNTLYKKKEEFKFIKVFYFRLREFSEGYLELNKNQKSIEIQIKEQLKSAKNCKLLFLFDGYDEFNNKSVIIDRKIVSAEDFPDAKIILTSREKYASTSDYNRVFENSGY